MASEVQTFIVIFIHLICLFRAESTPERFRTERLYGVFHRRIPLDQEIKEDEVKASYKDGILRIEMPKAEEAKGGKSIPIETEQSS